MNIFKSASRFVFIMIAVGAVAGLFTGHIKEENFMLLATGVFSYYFSNKSPSKQNNDSEEIKS